MRHSLSLLLVLALISCATVVQTSQPPVTPHLEEFEVPGPRPQVFDATLSVAQQLNLSVDVLEKSSGLLKFEQAALSSEQLDEYCHYPWVRVTDGAPFDTFSNWSRRSITAGAGNVRGSVAMTVLLKEQGTETAVSVRTSFTAQNARETSQCNSTGQLEKRFMAELMAELDADPGA